MRKHVQQASGSDKTFSAKTKQILYVLGSNKIIWSINFRDDNYFGVLLYLICLSNDCVGYMS